MWEDIEARVSSRIDDLKQGVSRADVYQMMAYVHLYRAPRLTLLYPHHKGFGEAEGTQAQFWITGQAISLETSSIDVAKGENVPMGFDDSTDQRRSHCWRRSMADKSYFLMQLASAD